MSEVSIVNHNLRTKDLAGDKLDGRESHLGHEVSLMIFDVWFWLVRGRLRKEDLGTL